MLSHVVFVVTMMVDLIMIKSQKVELELISLNSYKVIEPLVSVNHLAKKHYCGENAKNFVKLA